MKRHKRSHTVNTLFHCSDCEKCFNHQSTLLHHRNYKHSVPKTFKCDVCEKNCMSIKNLQYHLNVHVQKRMFKCEQCDSEFFNPWSKKNR